MGNKQSNKARDEPNLETIENEKVMTREQLREIQSLFEHLINICCFAKVLKADIIITIQYCYI